MKHVPISDFRKYTEEQLEACRPCIITFNGEVIGGFVDITKTIIIEDLHPNVQNQFKLRENLARAGMPK